MIMHILVLIVRTYFDQYGQLPLQLVHMNLLHVLYVHRDTQHLQLGLTPPKLIDDAACGNFRAFRTEYRLMACCFVEIPIG